MQVRCVAPAPGATVIDGGEVQVVEGLVAVVGVAEVELHALQAVGLVVVEPQRRDIDGLGGRCTAYQRLRVGIGREPEQVAVMQQPDGGT